jgi:hypothetical protein
VFLFSSGKYRDTSLHRQNFHIILTNLYLHFILTCAYICHPYEVAYYTPYGRAKKQFP